MNKLGIGAEAKAAALAAAAAAPKPLAAEAPSDDEFPEGLDGEGTVDSIEARLASRKAV